MLACKISMSRIDPWILIGGWVLLFFSVTLTFIDTSIFCWSKHLVLQMARNIVVMGRCQFKKKPFQKVISTSRNARHPLLGEYSYHQKRTVWFGYTPKDPRNSPKRYVAGSIFDVRIRRYLKIFASVSGLWYIPGINSIYLRLTMALQKVVGSPPPHTYLYPYSRAQSSVPAELCPDKYQPRPKIPKLCQTLHTPLRRISGVLTPISSLTSRSSRD
jgi:hypothetical protein